MTHVHVHRRRLSAEGLGKPILFGLLIGSIQAASPLAATWIEPATAHALYIAFIAAVYIGFAVADGRPKVIAGESAIAGAFLVLAAAGDNGTAWLLVAAYAAHGVKDIGQHRRQFVAGTRWWPPFCAAVDMLVAAVLAVEIAAGVDLHG